MKIALQWLAGAALLFGTPAVAAAPAYSSLYVFGDSLVDAGNANIATLGAQASYMDGYYDGRFSNGPNFADYLSGLATPQPYTVPALAGGLNYAVGGADAQTKIGAASPSFLEQLKDYSTFTSNAPIPGNALVLVTFGGNDVRDTVGISGPIDFSLASAEFLDGLELLYQQGARNFVITGSPDIGLLPASIIATGDDPTQLAALTARSIQISDLFQADTEELETLPGAKAQFFNLFDFEHDLLANPTEFGLPADLNTTTPCQIVGGGSPQLANCTDSLYFDAIHPTTIVDQAIAGAIYNQLAAGVPEPTTWTLLIIGFAAIGTATRRPRNRAMLTTG